MNKDFNQTKCLYERPIIEVIEMEHEGNILAGSFNGNGENFDKGGGNDQW